MSLGRSGAAGDWPFEPYQQASAPQQLGAEGYPALPVDSPPGGAPVDWTAPPPGRPRRDRSHPATAERDDVRIDIDVGRAQQVIWLITGTLIFLDFLVSFAAAKSLLPYAMTRFFDGDSKVNFPTGAKTTLLLFAVVLMLCCWAAGRRSGDRAARGWLLLALVTGFAFIDETTFLHQSLSDAMQKAFHFTGVLKYSWTIIYLPAGLLVGIFLLRNLRFMLPEVRNRLLPGGAVYVIGAMALEPIKSHASENGENTVTFKLTAAVSDSLELAGLALLVCALLVAAHLLARGFTFSFRMGARPATSIELPPDNYPQHGAPPQHGAHAQPGYDQQGGYAQPGYDQPGYDQQGGYAQPAFPQSGGFATEQDYPTAAYPQGYRPQPRPSAPQPPPDPSQQWADPSTVSHAGGPPPPPEDPFNWPR